MFTGSLWSRDFLCRLDRGICVAPQLTWMFLYSDIFNSVLTPQNTLNLFMRLRRWAEIRCSRRLISVTVVSVLPGENVSLLADIRWAVCAVRSGCIFCLSASVPWFWPQLLFFSAFELKRLAADQLHEPIMLLSPLVLQEQYLGLLPLTLYPLYSWSHGLFVWKPFEEMFQLLCGHHDSDTGNSSNLSDNLKWQKHVLTNLS